MECSSVFQYGKCFECGNTNSGSNWCYICQRDSLQHNFHKWTSGDIKIDLIIQQTQLDAKVCVDYLEWIPFDDFDFTKYHARGAFSVVYFGIWIDGPRYILDDDSQDWIRSGPTKCALKRIENSQSMSQEYLENIKNYHKCFRSASAVVDCFGITRDPTGHYIDDPEPSPTSEQFDIAEEKRFVDLINKTFPKPNIHNQAIYISRLLDYKSLCESTQQE
ncbi:3562_t:CDS:2 [Scutellospora calospora]|uniref:3562_t:CDS:1 n=1 Tax=Scutellospora calospora TaxID=85575 RepID=A0ACA9LQ91_9GLOM|nr:3562_t:CDS:2 [Scutellospora calospora]